MSQTFWANRSVFVTGHTGFKGAWLVLLLKRLGADVAGYALAPETGRPSLFEQARVAELCSSVTGDVRDLPALRAAMLSARPTVVLHLAAQALVRASYDDPLETYSTNVMGTVNVLEAARAVDDLKGIVVVTSDKCYENREWPWAYRENDAMGGYDPYSSSKGCAELVTSAYSRSFFAGEGAARVASARAGNVIGGGDYACDRLVPDLLRSFMSGEKARIRNPLATRPWQHVLEPLSGYLQLAEWITDGNRVLPGGWNFGPDPEATQPVQLIADALAAKWGGNAGWDVTKGANPHEAQSLSLDCSLARTRLGWRPCLDIDRSLDWIVSWTRAVAAGSDPRNECLDQIEQYLSIQSNNAKR